ncbi:MAG: transcriptional regulator containing an amidase domain and an AraC-type DNA-binding domain [Acidimicrobiaceae bacterium]|nr:transcriptional regulator containing an amidase domain and an AraC-type DNA-binding domain [Acidimicrobiaceae bacterium]
MRIEIVVFDGFDELDALGPYEVLRTAQTLGADLDVAIVRAGLPGTVTSQRGLRIGIDEALGHPDAVMVPGGGWVTRAGHGIWQEVQREELPARLSELAQGCAFVASVCTGAMLLAAAGLVRGRPATTHHDAHGDLAAAGAEVIADARVVDDGNLLTSGGITCGLDLALWIVEREAGQQLAAAVAFELEHERSGAIWTRSRAQT